MSSQYKELYVANSIKELADQAAANLPKIDHRTPLSRWFRSAQTVFHQAKQYKDDGDLEMAYVLFLRFADIGVQVIPKHTDYKNYAGNEKVLLKKQLVQIITELEAIKKTLSSMYEARENEKRNKELLLLQQQEQQRKEEEYKLALSLEKQRLEEQARLEQTNYDVSNLQKQQQMFEQMQKKEMSKLGYKEEPESVPSESLEYNLPEYDYKSTQYSSTIQKSQLPPSDTPAVTTESLEPQATSIPVQIDHVTPSSQPPVANVPSNYGVAPPPSPYQSAPVNIQYQSVPPQPKPPSMPLMQPMVAPMMQPTPMMVPYQVPYMQMPQYYGNVPVKVAPSAPPRLNPTAPPPTSTQPSNSTSTSTNTTNTSNNSLSNSAKLINGLREMIIDGEIVEAFMEVSKYNTNRDIETCGILAGILKNGRLQVTTIIIPKQTGSSDTCAMTNEEEVFEYQDTNNLLTLGWIHTHPSHDCFLSSVDMHTQGSYQFLLKEAVAVVVAPKVTPNVGIFTLTDPLGLTTIQACDLRGFHPHEKGLYKVCDHVTLKWKSPTFKVVDLRKK